MLCRHVLCPSGYNRTLAAFIKADVDGDGLLDRHEWSEGSGDLGQMLQLQCNGTMDEFDEVLRVAATIPALAKASPLSISPLPRSDGGESPEGSDSTHGITYENLCEWCVVKLRSDDGLACNSKIALYADVFDELWEVSRVMSPLLVYACAYSMSPPLVCICVPDVSSIVMHVRTTAVPAPQRWCVRTLIRGR